MIDFVFNAENQWSSCIENCAELDSIAALHPHLKATALKVFEASEYVALACLRNPELLVNLIQHGTLHDALPPNEMARRLQIALRDVTNETELHQKLRHFRRAQMVRIIWRDISRLAPLSETLEDLSALADACIEQALAHLHDWQTRQLGVPLDDSGVVQQLIVLGMGKLGARELNVSSDIDLIFAFPQHGKLEGRQALTHEQFFIRLGQKLIQALGNQTADGFVFRVDCRLRPYGDAGALALSFNAMENYYQSQAREWERYAMVKARVITGDPQASAGLMSMLQHFVYRRFLDFDAIDSLRKMKQLISRELQRKGKNNCIKLGPGGIREIEFIGQVVQLIRGGRDPELRVRPILQVLSRLGSKGLLPDQTVTELIAGYTFLRLVENRLQAWQDKQTHQLPDDDKGQLRLARSMGYADWASFNQQLELHRDKVQQHFDQMFAPSQEKSDDEQNKPLAIWSQIWHQELDQDETIAFIHAQGYAEAHRVDALLKKFRQCATCRRLGLRGQERMDQLIPILLQSLAARTPPSADTLERLLRLIESIARRTSYLALLVEYPSALKQLVQLGSASSWIIKQLIQQPILLDELLDVSRLYRPLCKQELEEELKLLLATTDEQDLENFMERLRQFAQSNMLRVAAADSTGLIPIMTVSDYLTWIAETILKQVIAQTWQQMTRKHGNPAGLTDDNLGLLLIGYGKLGGQELGYGSDLDLVFLCNATTGGMTSGPKSVANEVFYARLGQRMIHLLSTRTPSGRLYEVDMRLRPNGKSGLLVTSMEAFEIYQRQHAWTWEHQALLRARPVAGDESMIQRFAQIRHTVLTEKRDPAQLQNEVRQMREKMRRTLDGSKDGFYDLKQGRGGIVDIEFMVQYAVLRWAFKYPDLLDWTDNVRFLSVLAKHEVLGKGVAQQLTLSYRGLRNAYHHAALMEQKALIEESLLGAKPETLPDHENPLSLAQHRENVMDIWDQLMIRKIA